MPKDALVKGEIDQGVLVLTVSYDPDLLFRLGATKRLADELLKEYEKLMPQSTTKSCVVVIKAEVAGSPLVKALFELYDRVLAEDGEVFVVDYPPDYIDSLTTMGLLTLAGFEQSASKEEAMAALQG